MTLRELQCLCTLVDAGFNISRAAETLHATQPAISKQLRQLEDKLGIELIRRQVGRPVELTEDGESILSWARRALQCTANIQRIALDARDDTTGRIDIATTHEHAKYILLPVIVAFRRRYPGLQINIIQGHPDRIPNLLRAGRISIGISPFLPDMPKELICMPFQVSRRVLIAPKGHAVFEEKEMTLEKLAAYPLVIQHSLRRDGAKIIRRFEEAGLRVEVVVQALDADVNKAYVAAGMGVGIVPAFTYEPQTDILLASRDIGHLFDDAVSCVLLKRQCQLQRKIYEFLQLIHPSLSAEKVQGLVFEGA